MTNEEYVDKADYTLTDRVKAEIKDHLRKSDDVATMYDDGQDSLYLVEAGLGGRIAILGNEMILRSVNPNTFTKLTDLVLEDLA